MSSKLITKKEMKRNSKSQLLKIAKEGGLQVSKKMSKAMIVDMLFKNKDLRSKMIAPAKRKPTEKQLAARKKFAERARKKTSATNVEIKSATIRPPITEPSTSVAVKSRVKVDPKASNKNEPAPRSLKMKPRQSTKIGKIVASTAPKMRVSTDKKPKLKSQIIGKITIVEQEKHEKPVGKLELAKCTVSQ